MPTFAKTFILLDFKDNEFPQSSFMFLTFFFLSRLLPLKYLATYISYQVVIFLSICGIVNVLS